MLVSGKGEEVEWGFGKGNRMLMLFPGLIGAVVIRVSTCQHSYINTLALQHINTLTTPQINPSNLPPDLPLNKLTTFLRPNTPTHSPPSSAPTLPHIQPLPSNPTHRPYPSTLSHRPLKPYPKITNTFSDSPNHIPKPHKPAKLQRYNTR